MLLSARGDWWCIISIKLTVCCICHRRSICVVRQRKYVAQETSEKEPED